MPKGFALEGKSTLDGSWRMDFPFLSLWGNFLEAASLIAVGPGLAVIFDSTNIVIDFSFGLGRVFNAIEKSEIKDFGESVLAANLSVGKFWWLSGKTSMGVTLSSGIHGLTVSQAKLSSFGFNAGLSLAFLLG